MHIRTAACTRGSPVNSHRRSLAILSFFSMGMILSCTPSAEPTSRTLDDSYRIELQSGIEPSLSPRGEAIIVYLIREARLVPRPRVSATPNTPRSVLEILAAGPSERELNLGLRTSVSETVIDVANLVITGRSTSIEVFDGFGNLTGEEQALLVGQIVLTLAENFEVDDIVFSIAGAPYPVVGPNGEVFERPVTATDFESFLFSA